MSRYNQNQSQNQNGALKAAHLSMLMWEKTTIPTLQVEMGESIGAHHDLQCSDQAIASTEVRNLPSPPPQPAETRN